MSRFVVLGCRWDRSQGEILYLVAYDDEVELELSRDEMRDLLNGRVSVDGQ